MHLDGDVPGLWAGEDDVVPLATRTLTVEERTNGDRSASELERERLRPGSVRASDLTSEETVRPTIRSPRRGWRRAVHLASAGLVTVGPSAAECRQRELIARVKTPIAGCRKVAFLSRKGGVGKTTTCLLTGHTFASYRGDRVVALDANPDAGTLAHRLRRESTETIATLLDDREAIGRYADVRAYTSQAPSRLEVVAGDERSQFATTLGNSEVADAIALLEGHYNLVCLDTAAGVLNSAAQGVLDAADQVVIVSPPSLDGARAASATLDWLHENGHDQLAQEAVAVLNGLRGQRTPVDLDRLEHHFASRCRACIRIPWDPHLDTGAEVTPEHLRPETRQAYLELAAAIAGGFTETPTRRQ